MLEFCAMRVDVPRPSRLLPIMGLLVALSYAFPTTLTFNGAITGTVNGDPLSVTTAGQIDTTGLAGNSGRISFGQVPSGFTPLGLTSTLASQLTCIICSNGLEENPDPAFNLFTLTGGNYNHERIISYPDFPGSSSHSLGTVRTSGDVTTYSATLVASYSGPTDLIGISNYRASWQAEGDQIQETGSAQLLRSGGPPVQAIWMTTYSRGGTALTNPEALSFNFALQPAGQSDVNISWNGVVKPIPEPGTGILLGSGLLAGAGIALRRRRQR